MDRVMPNRGNKYNNFAQVSDNPMIIHKNMYENTIIDEVNTIKLIIDGKDRNSEYYQNPYTFTVTMGNHGTSVAPHLEQSFKNVKYVKINYVILPRYISYNLTSIDNIKTYSPNENGTILEQYRFIMLKIKELNNKNSFSTSNNKTEQCFILYRNLYDANSMTDIWYPLSPTVIYKQGELRNLSKMTIEILSDSGEQLLLKSITDDAISDISFDDINNNNPETSNFYLYSPFCEILLNIDIGIFGIELNI